MDCFYCSKPTQYAVVIHAHPPGGGAYTRKACFPCLSAIAEKVMRDHQKVSAPQDQAAPIAFSLCIPCPGCGGQ